MGEGKVPSRPISSSHGLPVKIHERRKTCQKIKVNGDVVLVFSQIQILCIHLSQLFLSAGYLNVAVAERNEPTQIGGIN